MSFLALHKLVTYLIAGLGLVALTLGLELGPVRAGAFAVGYLGSLFAEGALLDRPGWSRAWTAIVVVAFAVELVRALFGAPVLELGVEYAAFLQISRLYNRRGARDHQQIAVLAFLHLVAATVLTTDVRYALVFLGFVVVTPWMLALSHLRREIEDHYPRPASVSGDAPAPDVRRVLQSRRLVGAPFLLGTVALSLPLFLTTALLFLAFPRVGLGMVSFGSQGGRNVTGFGRDVSLGDFGVIQDDPTVVLRVYAPPDPPWFLRPPYRLRGTSFDRYDGLRWSRTDTEAEPIPRMFDYFSVARWPRPAGDHALRILLDHLDEPVMFLPEGTIGLTVRPRQRHGIDVPRRIYRGAGFDVRYADADDVGLSYVAHVTDPRNLPIGGEAELPPEARARYLALPDLDDGTLERYSALARSIGGETMRERIARVESHLREEGRYRYTRRLEGTPEGVDPLAHFLFENGAGHCEYFSTAAAILLRTVGVPTRNVTGFYGGAFNEFGGYWSITQGDAHSWVEAWVDGFGWVTVEPTPDDRTGAPLRDGVVDDLRALVDALRTRWLDYVVTYDLQTQVDALSNTYDWLVRMGVRTPSQPGGAPASWRPSVPDTPDWAPWLLLLVPLGWLYVRWRARRSVAARPDVPPDVRPWVRLYDDLERLLGRHGHARPPTRTPRDHAAAWADAGLPGADLVCEITEAYNEARFAGRSPPEGRLKALSEELSALRATLHETHGQRTPRHR